MIGNGYGNSSFLGTHGILARSSSGGVPPTNTVAPVISGTQVVGSTLTSTTGTWIGTAPITYTYQWYRGATLISGATLSTYVLVQADAGNTSNITCKVTGTNAFGNATATSNTLAQIFDFDANAFITSATITDTTQKAATNSLTIDLKGYSIWTKMKALYPFVGGTSSTHSYNLKNPAQYQITWNGGQTHDANGYTPGVNGYGNTGFATNLFTSANDFGLSTYIRTNTTSGADIGVFSPDLRYIGSNLSNFAYFGVGNTFISGANTDAKAFWQVNRTSASLVKGFKNSSVFVSGTTGAGTLGARTVFIGALNDNGSANFYAGRQHAFDAIHDGLTDTESANFYTAVQAFQTALSRNV